MDIADEHERQSLITHGGLNYRYKQDSGKNYIYRCMYYDKNVKDPCKAQVFENKKTLN